MVAINVGVVIFMDVRSGQVGVTTSCARRNKYFLAVQGGSHERGLHWICP
jgi:hypothetical protein